MDLIWRSFKLPQGDLWRCQQWDIQPEMGLDGRSYTIAEQEGKYALFLSSEGTTVMLGTFGSLNGAQRAAQADHDAH